MYYKLSTSSLGVEILIYPKLRILSVENSNFLNVTAFVDLILFKKKIKVKAFLKAVFLIKCAKFRSKSDSIFCCITEFYM